jgi:serine/threonine protein phosphatase PrpC
MYLHKISLLGLRPTNEDAECFYLNLDNNDKSKKNINLIGIFDGHGGPLVSKYLSDKLPPYFYNKSIVPDSAKPSSTKYHKYIIKLFDFIQEKIRNEIIESKLMGSTAIIAQIYKNSDKNSDRKKMQIINVGDCRAVLCNKYNIGIPLTKDHKPTSIEEFDRITKLGGKVTQLPNDDPRIGGLSVSRSIGDIDTKPYVSHQPEIFDYDIDDNDKFIILACDGLWDVFDNQSAVDFVLHEMKNNYKYNIITNSLKNNIAMKLASDAIKRGSTDNVSCMVLFFK